MRCPPVFLQTNCQFRLVIENKEEITQYLTSYALEMNYSSKGLGYL
jgi:hypothetical protein